MLQELQTIQDFLEEPLSDDPYIVEQRGSELSVYMARSGKIFADATAEYKKALNSEIVDVILPQMAKAAGASYTVQNMLAKSACHEKEQVALWAERIHKTCVRQLDWCRSVLSKAKEQMRIDSYATSHITND